MHPILSVWLDFSLVSLQGYVMLFFEYNNHVIARLRK